MLNRLKTFLSHNLWIMLLDIVVFCLSYLIALYFRMFVNGVWRFGSFYQDYFWAYIPFYIIASLIVFGMFRLYGGMWQYAGIHDLNRIIIANLVTVALNVGISIVVISFIPGHEENASRLPIAYYVIGAVTQFLLTSLLRFVNRFYQEEKRRFQRKIAVNVMVVGTGETSRIVRRQIEDDPDSGARIVCILTYKTSEAGTLINGTPVLGNLDQIETYFAKFNIQRVILADSIMPMSVREKIRTKCKEGNVDLQDFSGFVRYDNNGLPFQRLMECVEGKVTVFQDGKLTHFNNGEHAVMSLPGRHDVKAISIQDDSFFVELISYAVKPLIVYFITNRPDVALVAEKYGVDRIWVDLEIRGKEERQHNMNTVKSNHKISDIAAIKPLLTRAEMMVRINSWYEGSPQEINEVIEAGADIIMLPYWKTVDEVRLFLDAIQGRCKTSLLLETKEAVECIDDVLAMGGFDEIHIGLNDLHLSYGMNFMFEPLADGIVERLCNKFKQAGIPFGFGGIAKLGSGMLPAERIIMEHYRLGSTRAILSRSFCDVSSIQNIEDIEMIFRENMEKLREYEVSMANMTQEEYVRNKMEISRTVDEISEKIRLARSNGL